MFCSISDDLDLREGRGGGRTRLASDAQQPIARKRSALGRRQIPTAAEVALDHISLK